MRVICIDDSILPETLNPDCAGIIKFGETYEAIQSTFHSKAYLLHGYGNLGFLKKRFVPLSEIDEKELAHAEPIESTFILKEV